MSPHRGKSRLGLACSLIALGLSWLLDAQGSVGAQPSPLGTAVSTNQPTFKPGDTLSLALGVTNPGLAALGDFYLGVILPDGNTIVEFTDLQFHVAIGTLSQVATLGPIVGGVNLAVPFTFGAADFFRYMWSGAEPRGRYVFFLAAARSGEPLPGSLLALSTAELTSESAQATPQGALHFDGLTNYVVVPTSPELSVSPAGLTVAAWVRPDTLTFPTTEGSLPTQQYVHWLGKGEPGQQEWVFRMYSNPADPRANRVSAYVFNPSGGLGCGGYFQDPLQVGQWVHVVSVVDTTAQQIAIYKNGTVRGTTSFGGLITPTPGPAPLRLGTRDFASFLQGALGPVRVWARPLTATEVQNLYTANAVPPSGLVAEYLLTERTGSIAHDTSGHGHHGTIVGAAWEAETAPVVSTTTGSSGGGC